MAGTTILYSQTPLFPLDLLHLFEDVLEDKLSMAIIPFRIIPREASSLLPDHRT